MAEHPCEQQQAGAEEDAGKFSHGRWGHDNGCSSGLGANWQVRALLRGTLAEREGEGPFCLEVGGVLTFAQCRARAFGFYAVKA